VIGKLRIEGDSPEELRRQHWQMVQELAESGSEALEVEANIQGIDPAVIERVRQDSLIGRQEPMRPDEDFDDQREEYIRLRIAVLEAERQRMLQHRKLGTFSSEVIDNTQKLLDLEEARLQQLSDQND